MKTAMQSLEELARQVKATCCLFIVLMLATFTANLAALLAVERMETTVQSLEELARQVRATYCLFIVLMLATFIANPAALLTVHR